MARIAPNLNDKSQLLTPFPKRFLISYFFVMCVSISALMIQNFVTENRETHHEFRLTMKQYQACIVV